jgi:hypothetical protein
VGARTRGSGWAAATAPLWSRAGIDDVIRRRRADDRLDRGGLAGVPGEVILGRLSLQAITLGYGQPRVGFGWPRRRAPARVVTRVARAWAGKCG